MPAITFDLKLSGPMLTKDVSREVLAGANEGIDQLALQGQAFVQEQLVPGHGVRTGHLRRSIHGGLVRDLHGQIDAGLHQQGANVVYAEAVEVGQKARPIEAVNKKALAFRMGGRLVIVKRAPNWPGTKGLFMFRNAARKLQNLDANRFITEKILRRLGA